MGLTSILTKGFGYAKRILKTAPDAILGTGAEVAGSAMRKTSGSIFAKAKAGFKAVEGMGKTGSFFTRATANLGKISSLTKAGARAAKMAGKSSFLGGVKGFFKGLGKNMPFLAAAATIAFELPNIFKAGSKEGVGQALKETGKSAAKLAGGAAGAAIGSAICPGIGTVIGWMAGEWLTSKVTGPSYSEKVDYLAERGVTEEQIAELQKAGYSVDDMYSEAKKNENQPLLAQTQYSDDEINKLKKTYGLSDEEIAQAQANGYTMEDVEKLLKEEYDAAKAENTSTKTQQTTNSTAQAQELPEFKYQYFTNPFGYNGNYFQANPYTNDIYFQQTFNGGNLNMNAWQDPTNQYFKYTG